MKRIAIPVDTEELCSYGCGNTARYKNGSGKLMCCERHNKCPALKARNSAGVAVAHAEGRIPGWAALVDAGLVDRGWAKGKTAVTDDRIKNNKYDIDLVFSYGGKGPHKKLLIEERGRRCERCGNTEWQGEQIPIELEHIDGDNINNVKDNLMLLCPNCHALTPTWRGRKTNTGKIKVSDDMLLEVLIKKAGNVYQTLRHFRLAAAQGNYSRCNRIWSEYQNAGVVE